MTQCDWQEYLFIFVIRCEFFHISLHEPFVLLLCSVFRTSVTKKKEKNGFFVILCFFLLFFSIRRMTKQTKTKILTPGICFICDNSLTKDESQKEQMTNLIHYFCHFPLQSRLKMCHKNKTFFFEK